MIEHKLLTKKELPKQVFPKNPEEVSGVWITYRRVIDYYKAVANKKLETRPRWAGSLAYYPRELDFCLDSKSLLPDVEK